MLRAGFSLHRHFIHSSANVDASSTRFSAFLLADIRATFLRNDQICSEQFQQEKWNLKAHNSIVAVFVFASEDEKSSGHGIHGYPG